MMEARTRGKHESSWEGKTQAGNCNCGVKNKDCTACARGIQNHTCYKNWSDSSSAMESVHMVSGTSRLLVTEIAPCTQLSLQVYQAGGGLLRSWNV